MSITFQKRGRRMKQFVGFIALTVLGMLFVFLGPDSSTVQSSPWWLIWDTTNSAKVAADTILAMKAAFWITWTCCALALMVVTSDTISQKEDRYKGAMDVMGFVLMIFCWGFFFLSGAEIISNTTAHWSTLMAYLMTGIAAMAIVFGYPVYRFFKDETPLVNQNIPLNVNPD